MNRKCQKIKNEMIKGYSIFSGGMAVYSLLICTVQEHIRKLNSRETHECKIVPVITIETTNSFIVC